MAKCPYCKRELHDEFERFCWFCEQDLTKVRKKIETISKDKGKKPIYLREIGKKLKNRLGNIKQKVKK